MRTVRLSFAFFIKGDGEGPGEINLESAILFPSLELRKFERFLGSHGYFHDLCIFPRVFLASLSALIRCFCSKVSEKCPMNVFL